MKKFEEKVNVILDHPLNSKNLLFLDIETDGLSHKNKIAIIGLLFIPAHSKQGSAIQLFNEDYHSEKEILLELVNLISTFKVDYFISFNGNSFDFPFINARMEHYKLQKRLNKALNIDLLQIVRRHKAQFPLEKFNLKSVEVFLGIKREDQISGKDSVILYQAYLETHDPRLMDTICLHNYEDVLNMVALMQIFNFLPDQGMAYLYPNEKINAHTWHLTNYQIRKGRLEAQLSTHFFSSIHMDIFIEKIGYQIEINNDQAVIKLQLKEIDDAQLGKFYILDYEHVYNQDLNLLSPEEKDHLIIAHDQSVYLKPLSDHIFHILKANLLD